MTVAIQEILDRFDGLTEPEQLQVASEILRRVPSGELPPLHDDELAGLEPEDESARRARIAAMTPAHEDLEAAASPPPAEWYQEDWSK